MKSRPKKRKFQSTPPAEARGDALNLRKRHLLPVSIHSPRRSEGRLSKIAPNSVTNSFQSTPPAEARGDGAEKVDLYVDEEFQSTPPAEARGDMMLRPTWDLLLSFNPLPPPKRGETPGVQKKSVGSTFQSTPPPKRGETVSRQSLSPALECFNTPPPKRGETGRADLLRPVPCGFNPLPPPKRGETISANALNRPPPGFQSTPPAEARGDLLVRQLQF